MNGLIKFIGFVGLLLIVVCCRNQVSEQVIPSENKLIDYVNTHAGTGSNTHIFVGASMPFGKVQLGPNTRFFKERFSWGYHYSDSAVVGFTLNHQAISDSNSIGEISFLPYTTRTISDKKIPFKHSNEVSKPGYYSVKLDKVNINCELTSTMHTGHFRMKYPAVRGGLKLRFRHYTTSKNKKVLSSVKIINNKIIEGNFSQGITELTPYKWFRITFNEPFEFEKDNIPIENLLKSYQINAEEIELRLSFKLFNSSLLVNVSESCLDGEQPRIHLYDTKSIGGFDDIVKYAENSWEENLGKVLIEGNSNALKNNFYTAMYFAHLNPSYTDYKENISAVVGDSSQQMYNNFSLKDNYRAWFSLMSIIQPNNFSTWMYSLISPSFVPDVEQAICNFPQSINNYYSLPVLADAAVKGLLEDNDKSIVYKALKRVNNNGDSNNYQNTKYKSSTLKEKYGFVPSNMHTEAVSEGLEIAYVDWSISKLYEFTGNSIDAKKWYKKGQFYRYYYNPRTKLMNGKTENGEWVNPISNRAQWVADNNFKGGNAYQWSAFVPHDIVGLRELLGGKSDMGKWLDTLFYAKSLTNPEQNIVIGSYNHQNKANQHVPYLYNYSDRPSKTAVVIDSLIHRVYQATPTGISGTDDFGQMSSWYILNALGFYQICPGNPTYDFGRPLIHEAKIKVEDGWFTIKVHNNSKQNKYIKKVVLNNKKLLKPCFSYHDIKAAGLLEFYMDSVPN